MCWHNPSGEPRPRCNLSYWPSTAKGTTATGAGARAAVTDTDTVSIVIEDDGPVLIIIFLLVCLVSIAVQTMENARQRRNLAVEAGPNQEMRANRRMFFYTVLVIGLLTLAANYIIGITSSLAASRIDRSEGFLSPLDLPGTTATLVTAAIYALTILATAKMLAKKERLGLPEMLADLNHARRTGALENGRQMAHYENELGQLRAAREAGRTGAFSGGDFDLFFTAHESPGRPRLVAQLRYLNAAPDHRARSRYFLRNMLLNYRTPAGKWILPFALLAGLSLVFTVRESMAAADGDGDFSLALAWAAACVLGLAASVGQYFCDMGKALLESRREYISRQTELECRNILDEAARELAAASKSTPADDVARSPDSDGTWVPFVRIGRWEARRRRHRPAG